MGQRSSRKQKPSVRDSGRQAAPDPSPRRRHEASAEEVAAAPDQVVGYEPENIVGARMDRGGLPPPWTPCDDFRHVTVAETRRIPRSVHSPPPPPPPPSRFGYEIQDLDGFLSRASLQNPANIPVVLASSCVLYQMQRKCSRYHPGYKGDRIERFQKGIVDVQYDYEKTEQVFLPLGMVVNAVFKNKGWLYVQTPHGEEGYMSARSCLPLGILPPSPPPPRPTANSPILRLTKDKYQGHPPISPPNKTDNEKLRDTVSEGGGIRTRNQRRRRCRHIRPEEAAVDRLFLKAAAATSVASLCSARSKGRSATHRETLLLIRSDYHGAGCDTISVDKGDVVALVSHPLDDWFWVRAHDGTEGFIPSVVAGHGFL